MKSKLVAYIERDVESGLYVAVVPGVTEALTKPKCHTIKSISIKPQYIGVGLIKIGKGVSLPPKPVIIETKGESPEQYASW